MGLDRESLLSGLLCLVILAAFCLVEQAHLVFAQNIAFLLTGPTILGPLGIGEDFVHMLQLPL